MVSDRHFNMNAWNYIATNNTMKSPHLQSPLLKAVQHGKTAPRDANFEVERNIIAPFKGFNEVEMYSTNDQSSTVTSYYRSIA